MPNVPDVRVRLSAEGVAEVVAALQKIRAEAATTGASGAHSFNAYNAALEATTSLVEGVVAAFTLDRLAEFALEAARAAQELQVAAENVGTTVPRLQTLQAVSQENGVGLDKLTNSLAGFAKKLSDFRDGEPTASAAFRRLGISQKQVAGLDTAQAFGLVGEKLATLKTGADKTAVALEFVGTRGKGLVSVLDDIGKAGGLEAAQARAEALGLALDEDVVRQAALVATALDRIKVQAQNAATAFDAGLAPAVVNALNSLDEGATKSADGWKFAGNVIGKVLGVLIVLLADFADVILITLNVVGDALPTIGIALEQAIQGHFDKARKAIRVGLALAATDLHDGIARLGARFADLNKPLPPPKAEGTGSPPPGTGTTAAQTRLELAKQLADNELKLQELLLKNQADQETRRFAQGLISLRAYYDQRANIIRAGIGAEIAALKVELAAQEAGPDDPKKAAGILKTKGEIARKTVELHGQLAALGGEETAAVQRQGDAQLAVDAKLAAAQGRNHDARAAAIDQEVAAYIILLGQEGKDVDEQIRLGNALDQALRRVEQFTSRTEDAQALLTSLGTDRANIQARVAAGQLSELEGIREGVALELQRKDALEKSAALALLAANATHDAAKIEQARALVEQVRALGQVASQSQLLLANLGQSLTTDVGSGLVDTLAAATKGWGAFEAAGANALVTISQQLEKLLAQIAISRLFELLGLSFAGSAVPHTGIAPNPGVPLPSGFARGGLVEGPEGHDSILARLTRKEFVVRRAAVAMPGVLPLLQRINAGVNPVRPVRIPRGVPGFAEGGLVGGGTTKLEGVVTLGLAEGLVAQHIEGNEATRAILRVATKNARAFRRAIGVA